MNGFVVLDFENITRERLLVKPPQYASKAFAPSAYIAQSLFGKRPIHLRSFLRYLPQPWHRSCPL